MKRRVQLTVGLATISIGVTAIIAMSMSQGSKQPADPSTYEIIVEPVRDEVSQAIVGSQRLSDGELRSELDRLAPRLYKIEQFASFVHALQLSLQEDDCLNYKKWKNTWFESSATLFVYANLTGNELRGALGPSSSRVKMESAYVSAVTMLPLLEEASSKVSYGVLVDVFGYSGEDLLLESWADKE